MDLSYDGRLVTLAGGQEIRVFEGAALTQRALVPTQQSIASASLCPNSKCIVAGGEDMWAYLMDYPSGKVKQVRVRLATQAAARMHGHARSAVWPWQRLQSAPALCALVHVMCPAGHAAVPMS
jgi:hypothetical protein